MQFIADFSKQTGDFKSLSGTDLRVMALAYKLVKRNGEQIKLRKSPPEIKEVFIKPQKQEVVVKVKKPKGNGMEWAEVEGSDSSDDEKNEEALE